MINFTVRMKYGDIREDYFDTAIDKLSKLERVSSCYDNKENTVCITVHSIDDIDAMEFHMLKWEIFNVIVDMVRKNKTSGNEYFMLSALMAWMSTYCDEIYESKTRIANYMKKVYKAIEDDDIGIWSEYVSENEKGTCNVDVYYSKAFVSSENSDCDAECEGCENKCDEYNFFNKHDNCPLGMCDDE